MLKRLIANNIYYLRGTRDLFKKPTTATDTPSGSPFPYRFGGVDNSQSNQIAIEAFGSEKKQEFIQIYGKLLDAIVNKDKTWLNERVQAQLIEPLLSASNIKLLNRQSPIQLLYFNLGVGIGVTFERGDSKYKLMIDKNNILMYTDQNQNPASMMKFMTQGMPVLISYEMAVVSSRKLVLEQSREGGSEVHLLTLEQQTNVELKKMMGLMTESMDKQNMDKFRKMILGSKEPWKVGNIDSFLKKRY